VNRILLSLVLLISMTMRIPAVSPEVIRVDLSHPEREFNVTTLSYGAERSIRAYLYNDQTLYTNWSPSLTARLTYFTNWLSSTNVAGFPSTNAVPAEGYFDIHCSPTNMPWGPGEYEAQLVIYDGATPVDYGRGDLEIRYSPGTDTNSSFHSGPWITLAGDGTNDTVEFAEILGIIGRGTNRVYRHQSRPGDLLDPGDSTLVNTNQLIVSKPAGSAYSDPSGILGTYDYQGMTNGAPWFRKAAGTDLFLDAQLGYFWMIGDVTDGHNEYAAADAGCLGTRSWFDFSLGVSTNLIVRYAVHTNILNVTDTNSAVVVNITGDPLVDPEGSNLHYRIEFDDDPAFGSSEVYNTTNSVVGWHFWNGNRMVAFPSDGLPASEQNVLFGLVTFRYTNAVSGTQYFYKFQAFDGDAWGPTWGRSAEAQ
jgi:hypothetical protein